MSAPEDDPYELVTTKRGATLLVVKPGHYSVTKSEKRRWARDNTSGFRQWGRRVIAAGLVGGLTIAALAVLGSSSGPTDEVIAVVVAMGLAFFLFPVAEYVWRRAQAGEAVATDKARELQRAVASTENRVDELQARVSELESAPVPHLAFGMPRLTDLVHVVPSDEAVRMSRTPTKTGAWFVVVPLSNDPPAGVRGADAERVYVRMRIEDADGNELHPETRARWQNADQAPDRSVFAPVNTPELAERDIPPNGRDEVVDTVMIPVGTSGFYVWTDESMQTPNQWRPNELDDRFAVSGSEVVIRLFARGRNTDVVSVSFRVLRTDWRPTIEPLLERDA
ncbi:MAG: hypothetical protein QOE65_625 [Solirubrobacteraceae bacterium]|jgi:hypothetical protein|nr:hypothetical protein [Solirubrobacteraceae bacterium]